TTRGWFTPTTSGIRPTTVTVFQFSDIHHYGDRSTDINLRLAGMGYRPGLDDEILAIESQAGFGVKAFARGISGTSYTGTVMSSKCPTIVCTGTAAIYRNDKVAAVSATSL
ncbi:MAG: hypothetical protein WCK03_04245, partial [Candidatus Taylorbacteria bacterium]